MTILLGLMLGGAAAMSQASLAENTLGRWQTETRHGVVEIAACGAAVESDSLRTNPQLRDVKNKDAAKRDRLLKGLTIVQGFSFKGGEWVNGTIYNADDGGTYQATLTLIDHDTLKVKGCIVWPLCKSQTWKRLK
jgi:uncharacterized protein (DUF2147 family)